MASDGELIGGRLLDQGMYGCVFTPALTCKNKKDQPPLVEDVFHPPLTKLTLKEDAETEYHISSIIRRIPLWKNYFAVSESICEPAVKQTEKELGDCEVLEKYPLSQFRLLSMTYVGVPLTMYQFNMKTFDFFEFAKHLIEAGALLNLFGIVHRDLHQGNVLVDNHDVARIIDFNLAILINRPVMEADLSHKHTLNVAHEPPDSTLVNAISQGMKGEKILQALLYKKSIIAKMRTILGISLQDVEDGLYRFLLESKSVKAGDTVAWFRTYWRVIDSWAIGINLTLMIGLFSPSSIFMKDLAPHKTKLFTLLRRMCAMVPTERVDCVQALHYLDPTHFILRKYAKGWMEKVGPLR